MDDDSLENKFRLATIAPLDRRMKRKHLAVYGFLLDWYHRKYGDALASVRHIVAQLKERDPAGIGLYTGDVHSALKDLEAWGYITADVGVGRRASRYVPVWAHGSSVREIPNTIEDEISVRENQNTSVRENQNTTSDSVHKTQNEDPPTRTRLQDGVTGIGGDDCAPATPPLPVGLEATGAGGAQGGFEELWKTYFPKRGQGDKKKARSAYEALAPDADLHSSLLDSARAWFEAWQAQGKPDAPRKHLDTWLTGEHYECDPPAAYKPRERKAKANAKPRPEQPAPVAANDDWPMICDVGPFSPFGTFYATITGSKVEQVDYSTQKVVLDLTWSDRGSGPDVQHTFYYEHTDPAIQERGQKFIRRLADCLDIDELTDTNQLHDRRIKCTINDRLAISYSRAA
ncbi:hypothetical protein QTA58_05060 [Neorhizobium sp. CSC1952]|uniref:hypothetical protein n=1 Tax=Neorhizobium sp. CSC1952 TaxID=2978974 RepID=UPI0025A5C9EA|nr:hypothetical protein [Rhizobium sp. CSC1952]WJR68130.1 hypothetical protein QTA58_05060 [Rhizobium sp. CSC1952]